MTCSLMWFTSDSILLCWIVNLHITFKYKNCSKIILAKFMMMDIPLTYNVIIS